MINRLLSILGLSSIIIQLSFAQSVLLPDRWKLVAGDDSAYARIDFDDSGWRSVNIGTAFENQGLEEYDGTVWYRASFDVPASFVGKPLYLFLGKIDDADETFLNGVRIGGMGSFPPNTATAWNQVRAYRVKANMLKRHNVIAIRVNDTGGPGGMITGPYGLCDEKEYRAIMNPPPGPKHSFFQLVTSNGLIAAVIDARRGIVEQVRPHLFQMYDSAKSVQPFVTRIRLRGNEVPINVSYEQQTHVVKATYLHFTVSYAASFTNADKVFSICVKGKEGHVAGQSFQWNREGVPLLIDSLLCKQSDGTVEKYFLLGFTDQYHTNARIVAEAKETLQRAGGGLMDREVAFMRNVIGHAQFPKSVPAAQRAVLEQSLTVLKMAQVSEKEVFPNARGQVLASLPPGGWNIAWVRDGMYAIMGMNRFGLFDEAKKALSFFLNAPSGQYVSYRHTDGIDYGVGVPYQISVCRYFGMGREESDFVGTTGPNIELDGFGLFLVAFSDYVNRSGDKAFFEQYFGKVSTLVADASIHCIDTNGVIRIDSGPWERHLPGKQYAYTSLTNAAGLRDFAQVCEQYQKPSAAKYAQAADRLANGIRSQFVYKNRVVKGNVDVNDPAVPDFHDGGAVEAFGFNVLSDARLYGSHMREYERALRVPAGIGFSRIKSGDWYEVAEWIFLDLRTASVYARHGERAKAIKLIDWVTKQASLNYHLIPELNNEKTSMYDGAVPMVGFGAGAFTIATFDLFN